MHTRPMRPDDVPACLSLINDIIARGGTTAHETPFTPDSFRAHYFDAPSAVHVVEADGRVVGFQAVYREDETRFAIGTFTDREAPVKGAGRALFEATKAACRAMGGTQLIAQITGDNASGLGYYGAMGFNEIGVEIGAFTRHNGVKVDRVTKAYNL